MTMIADEVFKQLAVGRLVESCSVEMTARDVDGLHEAAPALVAGTRVAVAHLAGEADEQRIAAAAAVRRLGFVPVVHLSARRIASAQQLERYLSALTGSAQLEDVFVVAGDPPQPAGPVADALQLIREGGLALHGIRHVAITGYPEGHPDIPSNVLAEALRDKHREITAQGFACSIVTQFGFDAQPVLAWIERLRDTGVEVPVRIGLPGPASARTLIRFAARCGVGASATVLRKYGISLTRLLAPAGPDRTLDALVAGLDAGRHGKVQLHLYPFGGLAAAAAWLQSFATRERALRGWTPDALGYGG